MLHESGVYLATTFVASKALNGSHYKITSVVQAYTGVVRAEGLNPYSGSENLEGHGPHSIRAYIIHHLEIPVTIDHAVISIHVAVFRAC